MKKYKKINLIICLLIIFLNPIYLQSGKHLENAISAMQAGLFKEALKQLDIAVVKEPKNAEVHKLKALLYEAINENQNAISSWNNCLINTKDDNLIKEAKIHIDHLKGY